MIWETRDWLANTPLSALRSLEPYKGVIQGALVLVLVVVGALLWMEVAIAWFVLPLLVWAGVLFFRPGTPDTKRLVLFWVGTGLALTVMVEVTDPDWAATEVPSSEDSTSKLPLTLLFAAGVNFSPALPSANVM